MEPQIIESVTEEQLDKLKSRLLYDHNTKVLMTGENSFDIDGHGVRASASYDPQKKVLTVTVMSHPVYLPVSVIMHGLETAIAAAD